MIWEKLLEPTRFRKSRVIKEITDARNPFENDYSRIILSPHVRRLQNKAQVFPLDDTDFTRTRLTHSLEVSNFAKGLGLGVEKELINKKKLDINYKGYIPAILSTAGLLHDIGNPPFGHFGEDTIKKFFTEYFSNNDLSLCNEEKQDFMNFDGNVQGFRILRKLGLSDDEYSYNLTYPTLASIIKYPYSSVDGNKAKSGLISQKKFGYFQSEKVDYQSINEKLGLNGKRHPLVFLLEAADDIAYSVCDIEDGFRKNIITKDIIMEKLENNLAGTKNESFIQSFKEIEENLPNHLAKDDLLIQKFRISVQGFMLNEATKTFVEKHDDILNGNFDDDLVMSSDASSLRKAFKQLSIINFQHRSVLTRELVGDRVITFLLDNLIKAVLHENSKDKPKSKEAKLFALISPNYKQVYLHHSHYHSENYKKIQLVTDYVCGMTDSFALNLYRELRGQNI